MKKILILLFNDSKKKNVFIDKMNQNSEVTVFPVLKNIPYIIRPIRKMHILSGLMGIQIWFTNWKKVIHQFDTIICVATQYSVNVLRWIYKKVEAETKLINYYLDEVHISGYPVVHDERFYNWSFSYQNCIEFGMRYNPQFWMSSIDLSNTNPIYDVSYVGADRKGAYQDRTLLVMKLYRIMVESGFKVYFKYITSDFDVPENVKSKTALSLDDFLNIIKESKVILELVEENNQWMTQRVFYALGNKKKLITNNRAIVYERLYSPENVFILGHDSISSLKNFIKNPFKDIAPDILYYYEMNEWLKRFHD